MADEKVTKLPDRLRVEGVTCYGYGDVCKFPMTDPDLSVAAKAVYAMICAYSSNGTTAFPSREKFMDHLQIGKNKFHAAMKELTEQGYIKIKKQKGEHGHFSHNEYTLVSNPKKFAESKAYKSNGGTLSTAVGYTGLRKAGYGTMPRAVIIDSRLSTTAKVLYAYLASFTGGGEAAFPATSLIQYHLKISQNTYQRHMKQLIDLNYISIEQRHIDGRLASNNYYINDTPNENAVLGIQERRRQKRVISITKHDEDQNSVNGEEVPQIHQSRDTVRQIPQNKDTVHEDIVSQDTVDQDVVSQDTVNQDPVLQDPVTRDTNKNSSLINSSLNISPSINRKPHWMDGLNRGEVFNYIIANLEPYETCSLMNIHLSEDEINFIIGAIADFIASDRQFLRITGVRHDRYEVIEKLLTLDCEDYAYVHKKISKIQTPIKNLKGYYLACLYSAKEDHAIDLAREIEQDIATGF